MELQFAIVRLVAFQFLFTLGCLYVFRTRGGAQELCSLVWRCALKKKARAVPSDVLKCLLIMMCEQTLKQSKHTLFQSMHPPVLN